MMELRCITEEAATCGNQEGELEPGTSRSSKQLLESAVMVMVKCRRVVWACLQMVGGGLRCQAASAGIG